MKKHQALAVTRSPFEVKDAWRERRYRWHPMRKCWWCLYDEDKIKLEEEFIKTDKRLVKVQVKYTLVDIPEDRVFDPKVIDELL
ncbi:MAG: hypothetical protein HRU15_03720 [Planctomycetes bacterium]|nr:hypothetical protein [Planctomycetota bacterium]